MTYPKFFDEIETIKIHDELSQVLGAFDDGLIEFTYLDVVKSAGHSCPTVAGIYLMLKEGLKEFSNPKRGEISAYLPDDVKDGVTGVLSNVIAQITGATDVSGFHGLAGDFDRRGLMHFKTDMHASLRLKDKSGKIVDISYNPNKIQADSAMNVLMQKVLTHQADKTEALQFKILWQKRVESILKSPSVVLNIK